MNEQVLEIKDLSKNYNDYKLNVSFSVPKGYIMGLIGPNGAGKTTVIKLILNLIRKNSGEIKVFGLDHVVDEEEVKQNIGIVFDHPYLTTDWNSIEVEKVIKPFYKNWNHIKYVNYLETFKIPAKKTIQKLSRGMQIKLMIAVALAHNPKLLILDEPTSGLDPFSREELISILSDYILTEEKSVLFSTHITNDLERIGDYITFINRGCVQFTGTKDELMENYCKVKGGNHEITLEQQQYIQGLKFYHTHYEGLVHVNDLKHFSPSIVADPVSLDDIILYFGGGAMHE